MAMPNACASPAEWLGSWQGLSLIGILTSYFVISLLYMIGTYIGSPWLVARAKNELYQVFMTALFLASIVLLVTALCSLDFSDFGMGVGGNMFDIAELYLLWLRDKTAAVLGSVLGMSNIVMMLSSFMGGLPLTFATVILQPFAGLGALMTILNFLVNVVMICLLVTIAQIVVLKIINMGMLSVLLPVGVVCRSFPVTRKFGGALMGIALGLFVAYPFMLMLNFVVLGQPTSVEGVSAWRDILESLKSSIPSIAVAAATGNILAAVFTVESLIADLFLNRALSQIATVIFAAFLLPAINSIIIIAVVRDLSRALGEETDITTLTRMV
ncbi:MAG: hypothetical protein AB1468_03395 [Candidatus Micrarchaeota archaeon]